MSSRLPRPTSSYTGFYCHPTPSYLIPPPLLHWILLPSYPVLPYPPPPYYIGFYCHPTPSYLIPPPYYTGFYCHPTPSYLIPPPLLHWILLPSYPVLPYPPPPITLDSTAILPRPTLSPLLHWILLPSYPVSACTFGGLNRWYLLRVHNYVNTINHHCS